MGEVLCFSQLSRRIPIIALFPFVDCVVVETDSERLGCLTEVTQLLSAELGF